MNFIDLKKANYLINTKKFWGQSLKKGNFVIFGLEKANLTTVNSKQ